MKKVIELTEEMSLRDAGAEARQKLIEKAQREWLDDSEAQAADHRQAIHLARAIVAGVAIGFLLTAIVALCSGCTASVSIRPMPWMTETVDGGGEPLGWEDGEELAQMLEGKR